MTVLVYCPKCNALLGQARATDRGEAPVGRRPQGSTPHQEFRCGPCKFQARIWWARLDKLWELSSSAPIITALEVPKERTLWGFGDG